MGKLKLHNTFGNKLEDFIPIDKEMKQYLDDPRCYPEREGEELESIFS